MNAGGQLRQDPLVEDPAYLSRQLITCIGNKRALLPFIGRALDVVRRELGSDRLDILDAFAGSGVVSRYFKQFARRLISNDLEDYAHVISRCYLANREDIDIARLREVHGRLIERAQARPISDGFIRKLYAPADDASIQPGERAFYTADNARRLDTLRSLISELAPDDQPFFLAPLLSEASVHANTAGVFKGFYKDERGVGRFGGSGEDALARILGPIELPFPLFSRFSCEWRAMREDANALVQQIEPVDVAYFDPPYNQHPYGSNYFMLNLLCDYREPARVSRVSGIPADWRRSAYNKPREAEDALAALIGGVPAKYILLSYNNEGFISQARMREILSQRGEVMDMERAYNTFRGSRNLHARNIHVREQLYLVKC